MAAAIDPEVIRMAATRSRIKGLFAREQGLIHQNPVLAFSSAGKVTKSKCYQDDCEPEPGTGKPNPAISNNSNPIASNVSATHNFKNPNATQNVNSRNSENSNPTPTSSKSIIKPSNSGSNRNDSKGTSCVTSSNGRDETSEATAKKKPTLTDTACGGKGKVMNKRKKRANKNVAVATNVDKNEGTSGVANANEEFETQDQGRSIASILKQTPADYAVQQLALHEQEIQESTSNGGNLRNRNNKNGNCGGIGNQCGADSGNSRNHGNDSFETECTNPMYDDYNSHLNRDNPEQGWHPAHEGWDLPHRPGHHQQSMKKDLARGVEKLMLGLLIFQLVYLTWIVFASTSDTLAVVDGIDAGLSLLGVPPGSFAGLYHSTSIYGGKRTVRVDEEMAHEIEKTSEGRVKLTEGELITLDGIPEEVVRHQCGSGPMRMKDKPEPSGHSLADDDDVPSDPSTGTSSVRPGLER